jgi:hypothetical protein
MPGEYAMKTPLYILIFCVIAVASEFSEGDDNSAALPDLALQPPRVTAEFDPDTVKSTRGAQGVPAIERAANGRLWAAWYAGPSPRGVESFRSYVVLATSGDDGVTWSEQLLVRAPRFVHTYDPCLWIDPQRRLWFFWTQSAGVQDGRNHRLIDLVAEYADRRQIPEHTLRTNTLSGRMGVWAIVTENPGAEKPDWTEPRRIANGVMLNKPTVLKNGDWLLPVGLWRDNTNLPNVKFDAEEIEPCTIEMLTHNLGDERGSKVYQSTDQGKSFERIGQVRISGTRVDEHMIVERGDGSLWMLLRNTDGIAQSVSTDGGRTWSDRSLYLQGRMFRNKRFFIRRLKSGALLMVRTRGVFVLSVCSGSRHRSALSAPRSINLWLRNNSPGGKRSHMTAFVSDSDGATWKGGLLLDERESSYPDGTQAEDGTLFIICDLQRYTLNRAGQRGVGSVQMAVFGEEDVRAGKPVTDEVQLHQVVTQLQDADDTSGASGK